ncbi:MAG: hypothetical protein EBR29_05375 [Sphingobacteriia bacterium]|nr:hypothetical protein [Sphingobacteriia bacterium]
MAEVLIPLAMVVVMGTTKVSPTAHVEELMLPIVEVIFWAVPCLNINASMKRALKYLISNFWVANFFIFGSI